MFTREKKLIALLLSAALVLTMNTGLFAAVGAEDVVSAKADTTTITTPTEDPTSPSQFAGYTIGEVKAMSDNSPARMISFNVAGDFSVSFCQVIPAFGKKIKKGNFDAVLGKVTVTDLKTGEVYEMESAQVVRLKGAKADAFPTVSNAGLNIKKFKKKGDKTKDKRGKEIIKTLKKQYRSKAKSINKDLGLIIYPVRLTDDNAKSKFGAKLTGKVGKKIKLQITLFGNKFKHDSKGKKDSFKQSYTLNYTNDVLTVSSSDIWTPNGVSKNSVDNSKLK